MNTKQLTGYPSIDKPWLKYYSDEAINAPLPECSVYEYMRRNNEKRLDSFALDYFGQKISYRKLFEKIDGVAKSFLELGVKPGETVTMCVTNTPEAVYCFYALNKIGAISNMIDLRSGVWEFERFLNEVNGRYTVILDACADRVAEIIEHTKIEKVIVMSAFHSLPFPLSLKRVKIPNNPKFFHWNKFIKSGVNSSKEVRSFIGDCKNVATIAHTGGTTGIPKGVEISNISLNCVAFEYLHSGMKMEKGQKMLTLVPPFILNGLCTCLNMPLIIGLTCILIPQFSQEEFPNYLKKKPEHVVAAPTWWERLSSDKRVKSLDFSFLLTAASGGDGITRENEQSLNTFLNFHSAKSALINGYGMTELGSSVCTNMNHCKKSGSIGIPLPKMTISVFDKQGNEVTYGTQGEICVTGPSLMNGYCGKAESETNDVLKKHKDGLTWAHTGDLGHIDKDGFVFIDGRIKRIIIREGGFKVFPNMVENVISEVPDVRCCAVVGFKEKNNLTGEYPVAFIVSNGDHDKIIKECLLQCKKRLGSHFIPEKIYFIDELPLTPIGKVDFRVLERMAKEKHKK